MNLKLLAPKVQLEFGSFNNLNQKNLYSGYRLSKVQSFRSTGNRLRTKWLVTERGWYERRVHSDF